MVDEDVLIDLVYLFKKLDIARKENTGLNLSERDVIIAHDHLKAFFGSLSSN